MKYEAVTAWWFRHLLQIKLDHQISDDSLMEGPGLLSSGDDLFWGKKEAINSSISKLHAGGEEDTNLSMSPVCRAATSNVQHAGNATNLEI